ncbi:GNAT family N-acetyltransferase [Candidatus Roizmanbacteria bacterium]|nr:GNAT family N-acetyltransferase [Candidatus Roizmanbacteria bacterium]
MYIQEAKINDSKKILHLAGQLRKSAYLEMGLPIPAQLVDPASEKYLLTLFDRSDIHLIVAKENDEIIGFCMAVETPKITEGRNRIDILELIIDEKNRSKGIGSAFLRSVEKIAKHRGLLYVKVATGTKMKSNEFYKKNGYLHIENMYRKKIK